jgi:hypothetical protein
LPVLSSTIGIVRNTTMEQAMATATARVTKVVSVIATMIARATGTAGGRVMRTTLGIETSTTRDIVMTMVGGDADHVVLGVL